ncbi:hypothetical protein I7X12_20025 [Halosimplex litoreum]|uniref:Uncharacterized protein n=1 Tax=Halosimplex litoreum TaxID=1198301 RepID=A0A7T3KVF6_9EURY|nr:hypothetical protein [Halosimplex litoreum]QPV62968.1 hypothetical protein I7X12_20025 [Halosimplex litoreum]
MADDSSDEDLARLVTDLVRTLRELEDELEPPRPDDGPRLPTPRDLRRFTSEVAIPGFILILETNIRALRLLQRALRLADGAETASRETEQLRERAKSASESTLSRLDEALVGLQDAVEGRPNDDEAAELLDDARELRAEIHRRIRESAPEDSDVDRASGGAEDESSDPDGRSDADGDDAVSVDVDAELESIKRDLDELPGADDAPTDGDGEASGDGDGDDDEPPSDASPDDGSDGSNRE